MFTQLPQTSAATMTDVICAVQGYVSSSNPGLSVQETLQQVYNLFQSNVILSYAGNPNGHVAGTTYQLLWDTTDHLLYVCTTTGTSSTAVWSEVAEPFGTLITPQFGGTGVSNPTAHTLPVAEGSSNFNFLGPLTNGQLLIGSTGVDPVAATLIAGPGISIANGPGSITVSGTGSGIGWTEVTGTTQTIVADNGYVANNGGLVTFTLPSTAAFGTAISIIGKGAGGWSIIENTGQAIQVGAVSSTATTGSVSSTNQFDSIDLICTTANTIWTTLGAPQGNLAII